MILGLKIHMENINMYMYLCTNFQEHWYLDTEDTHTRVITKLSIFPCFFLCIFHLSSKLPSTKPPIFFSKLRKNGLQPPIEDDVILHEMYPFFVQILIRVQSITRQLFI